MGAPRNAPRNAPRVSRRLLPLRRLGLHRHRHHPRASSSGAAITHQEAARLQAEAQEESFHLKLRQSEEGTRRKAEAQKGRAGRTVAR